MGNILGNDDVHIAAYLVIDICSVLVLLLAAILNFTGDLSLYQVLVVGGIWGLLGIVAANYLNNSISTESEDEDIDVDMDKIMSYKGGDDSE